MIALGVRKKRKNKAKWILSELRAAVGTTKSRRTTRGQKGTGRKNEGKENEEKEARTRGADWARRRKSKKRNRGGAGRVREGRGRNGEEEEEERGQSGRPSLRNVN